MLANETLKVKKIQQLEIFWAFSELKCTECTRKSLQSSPTGPAEQWAGGSRCRSLSSCKKHRNIWKTWKSIPLDSIPSKVGTQTNYIKPAGIFDKTINTWNAHWDWKSFFARWPAANIVLEINIWKNLRVATKFIVTSIYLKETKKIGFFD